MPYTDKDAMAYLELHFECEWCSTDYPIEGLNTVKKADEVFFYCNDCRENNDRLKDFL